MNISLSPFAPENLVSRDESGCLVPSLVSLLIPYTQAEPGAYSRDCSRFPRWRPFVYINCHTPSGQSRVHRVVQLRTEGVHYRESAGTGPVVFKVVPVTGAAFALPWIHCVFCLYLWGWFTCVVSIPTWRSE